MNRQKGFTLIELLTVIVLLVVLAVVAIPAYVDLQDAAEEAQVESVAAALESGMQLVRTSWMIQGAPGAGSNSRVDLVIDGVSVRFRNGFPVTTNDSNHVPAGTSNRGSASSRLFHLFLVSRPEIVSRNGDDAGWAMLANSSCAPVQRQRCWEYRRGGSRVSRVTYSGGSGVFLID